MTSRERWALAILGLAVVLAMGGSLGNGFVYDDVSIIVQSPRVTDPAHWGEILNTTYWTGSLWRPLTIAAFALEWQLGGGAPWLFHLVSLLLYVAVAWGGFRLLRALEVPAAIALLVMGVFVVHPVHVEAVANVVGQGELWSALGLVWATLAYLRTRRLGFTVARLLSLLLAIAIATLGKEQGFVAPALLIGVEWLLLRDQRDSWGTRVRLLIPATAFTLLLLLVRSTVTGSLKGEVPAPSLATLGFGERLLTFLGTIPEYTRLLLWPVHLQAEYSPPHIPVGGPFGLRHFAGILVLATVVVLFLRCRRGAPVVAFGVWWMLATILPVSSVVTAAGLVMAERVCFLPSLGVALSVAGGLALLERVPGRRWMVALRWGLGIWAVGAAIRSELRLRVWHDQDGFFTALPHDAPGDYRAAQAAGIYWDGIGQTAQAERNFRSAMALWPYDPRTNEALGQLLRVAKRCPEAVPILTRGLTLDPGRSLLRARLVECLLETGDRFTARTVADYGIALGDSSFIAVRKRIGP